MQQDSLIERDAVFSCPAVLIAGPTASGKSALALEIAKRFDGAVINVDSMQVYRELRILSARPTKDEETEAPHRLYGHISARDPYSVAHWLADAGSVLTECVESGLVPIFIGGTGLYFKALLEGLSSVPKIDTDIRRYWREQASVVSADTLHRELEKRDPLMAVRLVSGDTQRIVRALEVIESSGRSLAVWQDQNSAPLLETSSAAKIALSPPRGWLHERIDARFEQMVAIGGMEEATALSRMGLAADSPALRAIGAAALAAAAEGNLELSEAIERSKAQTRQYAKRQETWFRNQMPDWHRFDPATDSAKGVLELLESLRGFQKS